MLKIPRSVILKNKFVSSNDEDQQAFRNGEVFSSLNIYIYIYIYIIRLTSLKIDKGEKTSHGEFKLDFSNFCLLYTSKYSNKNFPTNSKSSFDTKWKEWKETK